MSENRRSDPHVRCAEGYRGLKIATHSHTELGEAAISHQPREQREMNRRLLAFWRNAHQADNRQGVDL